MKISDGWKIKDGVSGLSIEIRVGKCLDKLHIESLDGSMNRDFWFTKDGEFDGTGSVPFEEQKPELREACLSCGQFCGGKCEPCQPQVESKITEI